MSATQEQFRCLRNTPLASHSEFDAELWRSLAKRLGRDTATLATNDYLRAILLLNLVSVGLQHCSLYCQQVCQATVKQQKVLNILIGDAINYTCRDIQIKGFPPGL